MEILIVRLFNQKLVLSHSKSSALFLGTSTVSMSFPDSWTWSSPSWVLLTIGQTAPLLRLGIWQPASTEQNRGGFSNGSFNDALDIRFKLLLCAEGRNSARSWVLMASYELLPVHAARDTTFLRYYKLFDCFVQILLKTSEKRLVMRSIPFHISF